MARDPHFSPEQSAAILRVPVSTVHDLIASGDLLACGIKGTSIVRIRQSALDAVVRPQEP